MLNKWRYVNYLDDGHVSYQCLQCRGHFSSGDCLGFKDPETGECTYYWHFCPRCGTKWEGCHRWEGEYGPRRQRVEDAIRQAWNRPSPPEPYTWLMEKMFVYSWYKGEPTWDYCFSWPGRVSAHAVYKSYKEIRERERFYHDDDDLEMFFRIRLTR